MQYDLESTNKNICILENIQDIKNNVIPLSRLILNGEDTYGENLLSCRLEFLRI